MRVELDEGGGEVGRVAWRCWSMNSLYPPTTSSAIGCIDPELSNKAVTWTGLGCSVDMVGLLSVTARHFPDLDRPYQYTHPNTPVKTPPPVPNPLRGLGKKFRICLAY